MRPCTLACSPVNATTNKHSTGVLFARAGGRAAVTEAVGKDEKAVEGSRAPLGPVLTASEANLKPADGHLGELRWGGELEVSPGAGRSMFRGPRGKFCSTGNILGGKSRALKDRAAGRTFFTLQRAGPLSSGIVGFRCKLAGRIRAHRPQLVGQEGCETCWYRGGRCTCFKVYPSCSHLSDKERMRVIGCGCEGITSPHTERRFP